MSSTQRKGGHRRVIASVAVGALVLSAAALIAVAVTSSASPTKPGSAPGSPSSTASSAATVLPASDPVRLRIPSMGVDAGFVRLRSTAGQQSIPLPHPAAKVGWYDGSPAPGSPGTSILVGFIAGQHAVFARLADLHRGDVVTVRRKDNRSASYVVDSIRGYRPGTLPASVYASTTRPALRLISCGGALRPGQPAENVVVSAHLKRITH